MVNRKTFLLLSLFCSHFLFSASLSAHDANAAGEIQKSRYLFVLKWLLNAEKKDADLNQFEPIMKVLAVGAKYPSLPLEQLKVTLEKDFIDPYRPKGLTEYSYGKAVLDRIGENLQTLEIDHNPFHQWLFLTDSALQMQSLSNLLSGPTNKQTEIIWKKVYSLGGRSISMSFPFVENTDTQNLNTFLSQASLDLAPYKEASHIRFIVGSIFTRELLESMVVLFALIVGLGVTEKKTIFLGALLGVSVSLLFFFGLVKAVNLNQDATWIRYFALINVLLSMTVLLLATSWNFHKIYWSKWISSLKGLSKRKGVAILLGAGFFSVFREGCELSLSMSLFNLEAGLRPIAEGFVGSLPLLLLVGFALFYFNHTAHLRKLLVLSGGLMVLVTIVFSGFAVRLLQNFSWLPTTPLPVNVPQFFRFWFSFYPSEEGFIAMFLVACITLIPLIKARFKLPMRIPAIGSTRGFTMVSALIGLALVAIAAMGVMAILDMLDKGTAKPRISATVASLDESITAAINDPSNYPENLQSSLSSYSSTTNYRVPFDVALYTTDINGNRIQIADNQKSIFFDSNGKACGSGAITADFPHGCSIRVDFDVLQTLSGASYPTFAAAYRIKVNPKYVVFADTGFIPPTTYPTFPYPAPTATLASLYPVGIAPRFYMSVGAGGSTTSCKNAPFVGMTGLDPSGHPLCVSAPTTACPAGQAIQSVTMSPSIPNTLVNNCVAIPQINCPSNYALAKYPGLQTVVIKNYASACKFITPNSVQGQTVSTQQQLAVVGCPLQHYQIQAANFSCVPGGGAPLNAAVKTVSKSSSADQFNDVGVCSLTNSGQAVPASWTVTLNLSAAPLCTRDSAIPEYVDGILVGGGP